MNDHLRALADNSLEAPERIEIALKKAFRRHHRARRLRRVAIATLASAAAAACVAMWVRIPAAPVGPPAAIAFRIAPAQPIVGLRSLPIVSAKPVRRAATVHKPTRRPPAEQLATTEFVALPYGDDALVEESATVVRMELPRSALRLAGFNVAQERANDLIQADVVVGADGLAHAVRFVRYQE